MNGLTPRAAPSLRIPVLAVLLCLVAAAILGAACMSKRWLTNGNDRVSVAYGLLRNTECRVGDCVTRPNSELPVLLRRHPPEPFSPAFVPAGYVALGAAAVAICALVICALVGLSRSRVRLPLSPASLSLLTLMLGLIAASVFVATKPGGRAGVGVDWAFVAFGVGVVAGIAGAQRLSSAMREVDEASASEPL